MRSGQAGVSPVVSQNSTQERPPERAPVLDAEALTAVREGFSRLLPMGPRLEPHLRGVLEDVLGNPGSLVRAQLAYTLLRGYGGAPEAACRLAVAVEYFHTASLLFDDLPSMDDASQRRGRPCPHRVHGEGATILGGLGLITRAYDLLWQQLGPLPEPWRQRAGALVAECLGVEGILDGQAWDLHPAVSSTPGPDALRVAEGKTVTLVRLALVLPALVAGAAEAECRGLDRLAQLWGLAYQILDDFKDELSSEAESGKTPGRDAALGRPGLPGQVGSARALGRLRKLLAEAAAQVAALGESPIPGRLALLGRLQGLLEVQAAGVRARLRPDATSMGATTRPPRRSQTVRRRGDAISFAAQSLEEQARRGDRHRTLLVTVPAPLRLPESLLDAQPDVPACFWHGTARGDGFGATWVGMGEVHRLEADEPWPFHRLRRRAGALAERLLAISHEDAPQLKPRFFGGLGFEAGGPALAGRLKKAADELWRDLGPGAFTLPRLLYRCQGDEASLTLALTGEELADRARRRSWLEWLEERLDTLAAVPVVLPEIPGRILELERPPYGPWQDLVASILRGIRRGTFSKVVAARRSRALLAAVPSPGGILGRLGRRPGAAAFRFAFRRGGSCFLGATPERLIRLRGRAFETEALAGTVSCREAEALRGSKIALEHRLVVAEIARRLTPWSAALAVAPEPRQHGLGDLVHLRTPIRGSLAAERHLLDLAALLHPTPAVAGLPTAAARRFLARREGMRRGWYAGPVGWFDTAGDGELAVALRCALLRGREAFLYAGAGIVAGSDPEQEAAEVALKEGTLLAALGDGA